MPLLTVRDFAKSFHIHHLDRHIPVFADVHLTLDAGRFLLISGANGAGKSSLLRCLYRTYLPTGGSALYESRGGTIDLARAADIDIAHLRRNEIGFVTQFLRPRPRVSALDLVAEPLYDLMPLTEAHVRAGDLLDGFGLKRDLWGAYPTTFSGGEQQKVNLARALIRPRRLLLLDEPTASLDHATREALTDRLAAIKADGTAMIAVLHHPEDMAALIDTDLTLHPLHPEAASHVAE